MRWCAIHAAQNVLTEPKSFKSAKTPLDLTQYIDEYLDWRRKIPLFIRMRDCPDG